MINIVFSIKQVQVMKGRKFCFLKRELCIKISFTVDKVHLRSRLLTEFFMRRGQLYTSCSSALKLNLQGEIIKACMFQEFKYSPDFVYL